MKHYTLYYFDQLSHISYRPPSAAKLPPAKLASTKLFARPLVGPEINVSEQQLKRWAMEGFDRPGFCFYVSGRVWSNGWSLMLP